MNWLYELYTTFIHKSIHIIYQKVNKENLDDYINRWRKHFEQNPTTILFFFFFVFLCLFRAAPSAHGGSQARGLIGDVAISLLQSHSNARSEPHLWPTPTLMAMLDPQPIEGGQGSNPQPHSYQLDLFLLGHNRNSTTTILNEKLSLK